MTELNNNLRDLSTDFLEVAIDTITSNEVVKEIPILGSLIKIALIKNSYSEKLLLKKLSLFLLEFENQTGEKKAELLKKLENPEEKQKLGENLILLIEKFDDFEKPVIFAKLFVEYLKGSINQIDFFRLGRAVNLAFISDLNEICSTPEEKLQKRDTLANVLSAGLSEISRLAVDTGAGVSLVRLKLSNSGILLQRIMK